LRVVLEVDDELLPVVALDKSIVGVPQTDADLYYNAAVRDRASVIFPFRVDGERIWQSVYVDTLQNGQTFYVLTEISFAQIDQYFARNADRAYAALFVLYVLLIFIAYWHARMVNYRTKYQEATEALEQQQLFTNMVAHELRAPLTAIRGYTSLMQERNQLSEPEQTHVQRVRTSTERLLSLVNDLLDVARIQSGKLEMNPKTTELGDVVEDVITELQVSAKEKEITLQQSGLLQGARAHVDPKRIHQALVNLVSNAIKYTKSGTIELEISQKRKAYEIRVKDTGMGMTAEDQRNLFAPFFRIQQEGEQAESESGSGLGMWITRQFIELMHGDIAVESIKGVGTHVVITVPRDE
jgi:signal transduction histidine kinase